MDCHLTIASPNFCKKEIYQYAASEENRATKIFFYVLAGAGIGAAAGICLAALVVSGGMIPVGAAIGAALGIGIGILLGRKKKSQKEVPLQISNQINDTTLKQNIQKIEKAVANAYFEQPRDYFSFHHQVTEITDEIKKHPSLQSIWKTYLSGLQGHIIRYSDGTTIKLDFSEQIKRLEGKKSVLVCEWWNPSLSSFGEDLKQIHELERECFGAKSAWSKSYLTAFFASNHRSLVVKDTKGKIIGFLLARVEQNPSGTSLHISAVGRKANSAKLGIGETLFKTLFSSDLSLFNRIFLEVREQNHSAKALYEKFGFQPVAVIPGYYSHPKENAIVMELNWGHYQHQHIA